MGRVGEDDVRAVAEQEAVGELLVDDADVSGDDDRAARRLQRGQPVQHRLDAAADEGEYDDVVTLVAHGVQELDRGDLTDPLGVDPDLADLRELAGRRGGPAAQQQPADLYGARAPLVRPVGQAARGERAPFPPGVGVGEDGDPQRRAGLGGGSGRFGRIAGTWGHVLEVRKAFR